MSPIAVRLRYGAGGGFQRCESHSKTSSSRLLCARSSPAWIAKARPAAATNASAQVRCVLRLGAAGHSAYSPRTQIPAKNQGVRGLAELAPSRLTQKYA